MYRFVKGLNRAQKRAILLVIDLCLVPVALVTAFALQLNGMPPGRLLAQVWPIFPLLLGAAAMISVALGIPRIKLNAYESRAIAKTAAFAAILALMGAAVNGVAANGVPGAVFIVFGVIFFLLSAGSRLLLLQLVLLIYRQGHPRTRVLIYGAGTTGMQLAAALKTHESIEPVAFVDDNPALQGLTVAGLPVHTPVRLQDIMREKAADRVILAMPSLSQPKQAQLARRLEKMGLDVHALPSFAQLVGAEELVDKLAPVSSADLLGRARLDEELPGVSDRYAGRSILVSGAGGSIGSELCRQILACKPARLVLFEMSELALYTVEMELRALLDDGATEIVPVLGSAADEARVRQALAAYRVEIVLHAAAYKHVPLVEQNPLAGLANNVLGTRVLAEAAREAGVARFILVSSDKAVRPTNVMGASKRLAELVVQDLASRARGTVFAMVRFGNVLGSSGSVIPLFQEQIAKGGPVTLTHEDVTRYFMTIPEAARLVLLAGSFARGGDVFVLDMGKPVPIRTLARQLIEAAGYTVRDRANPDGDIEIVTTQLRPGEKLHEELLIGEGLLTTPHPKILRAEEARLSEIETATALRDLRAAIEAGDPEAARAVIGRWVEGYPADARQQIG
jgi:FlaA1/EpsC-like NDP-sugar epimerase